MLNCHNLSVAFGGKQVLKNANFTLAPRTFTALIGKNGSGKSTLAAAIGQQVPYTGTVSLDNVDLSQMKPKERARRIAILPQSLPAPNLTVRELVTLGRNPHADFAVERAFCRTDTTELSDRLLPTLSGGERQRAYLAMILAQDADILILDEPTTYMDIHAEGEFLQLLGTLVSEGKTLLVILHNLSHAVKYAENLLILDQNTMVFSGTKEEALKREILEEVFRVRRIHGEENREIFFLP